jgi:hypothetical protein
VAGHVVHIHWLRKPLYLYEIEMAIELNNPVYLFEGYSALTHDSKRFSYCNLVRREDTIQRGLCFCSS